MGTYDLNENFFPVYKTLLQLKKKRLAVFGAGRFTQFIFCISKTFEPGDLPQIVEVLDDNPEGKPEIWGCKPIRPEECSISNVEGIFISTDCIKTARKFIARCRDVFGFDLALFTLFDKFPLSPILKDSFNVEPAFNGRRRFFNFGGGDGFIEKNWINVEYSLDTGNEGDPFVLEHDINSCEKIPVPDNEAQLIYSSHLIEHLPQAAVEFLFSEAYRILEPGGLIRIVCPDYDIAYNSWKQNDYSVYEPFQLDKRYDRKITTHEAFLCLTATPLFYTILSQKVKAELRLPEITDERLKELDGKMDRYALADYLCSLLGNRNYINLFPDDPILAEWFHSGCFHVNWFTYDKLINMLKKAGFINVKKSELLKSASPHMRNSCLFDSTAPWIQLYVEAGK